MPEIENAKRGRSQIGPLGVTWIDHELEVIRAGEDSTARLVLLNSGAATWRSRGSAGVRVSYHWLDTLGNPFVWDSPRTPFPHAVAPGEQVELSIVIRAPTPPGRYVLAFDLVEEFQFWFSEIGIPMLEVDSTVRDRITERRLAVVIHPGPGDEKETREALAGQAESVDVDDGARADAVAHLVAGCIPASDWSRRLLDAHAEGFAAVGGALVPAVGRLGAGRQWSWLRAWQPQATRNPRFREPLLLPSLVSGIEPSSLRGWPAYSRDPDLPSDQAPTTLFDGRIVVKLQPQSGRRPT